MRIVCGGAVKGLFFLDVKKPLKKYSETYADGFAFVITKTLSQTTNNDD
jgi:hypothetical protein